MVVATAPAPKATKYRDSTLFTRSLGRTLNSANRLHRTAAPIRGNLRASCGGAGGVRAGLGR